jgi:XTP/dITP diphosphohydrolase
MLPSKILIATTNIAKREELLAGISHLRKHTEIVSLLDFDIKIEPEETGLTFLENSKIKATFYAEQTGLPTIADDGGLKIDILNGEPGVKSKRWKGYECTDQELIEYALERLKEVPVEKRTAKLETCLFYYDPDHNIELHEIENIDGYIALAPSPRPTNGYPYRALFKVAEFDKYYDELTTEEHEKVNHRLKALHRLEKRILSSY